MPLEWLDTSVLTILPNPHNKPPSGTLLFHLEQYPLNTITISIFWLLKLWKCLKTCEIFRQGQLSRNPTEEPNRYLKLNPQLKTKGLHDLTFHLIYSFCKTLFVCVYCIDLFPCSLAPFQEREGGQFGQNREKTSGAQSILGSRIQALGLLKLCYKVANFSYAPCHSYHDFLKRAQRLFYMFFL